MPLSLLGAALVWSGWGSDVDLLHTPCVVITALPPAVANAELAIESSEDGVTATTRTHRSDQSG
jgi:hypothetical protein